MTDRALQAATRGASYHVLMQIFMRISTFLLNAYVLRHISGDYLGVVNVRLLLLHTTIVFLSRESVRRAALSFKTDRLLGRKNDEEARLQWQKIVNLCWTCLPVGVLVGVLLGYVWINLLEKPDMPGYEACVVLYVVGSVIELLAEPATVVATLLLHTKLRVVAETLGLIVRCVITAGMLYAKVDVPLQAYLGFDGSAEAHGTEPSHLGIFAIAQLSFCVTITSVVYAVTVWTIMKDKHEAFSSWWQLLPSPTGEGWLPSHLAALTWTFAQQGVLKQLLTEGEKYMMTFTSVLSFTAQGVYDLVNNLGSLVARFVFMPIEENFYSYFAGHLEREDADDAEPNEAQLAKEMASAATLHTLLKFVTLVSLVIATFGQAYSRAALHIYGGTLLSTGEAPVLMRAYAAYVVFLAVNGMTECFASACMSQRQLKIHNAFMVVFSIAFVAVAWSLTSLLGSVGLIAANAANMAARIAKSFYTIRLYLNGKPHMTSHVDPLRDFLPHPSVVATLGAALAISLATENMFKITTSTWQLLMHLGVGTTLGLATLLAIYIWEKQTVLDMVHLWRGRSPGRKKKAE